MTPEQLISLCSFVEGAVSEPRPSPGRWQAERMKLFHAFGFDITKEGDPLERPKRKIFCEYCGERMTPIGCLNCR